MAKDIKIIITAEDRASRSLKQIDNNVKKTGGGISKFGAVAAGAMVGVGVATAALGKKAFDASVSWESAFAGVRKTVDATEEEFRKLEDSLLDLSTVKPIEPENLATISELGGQLGVATEDLLDFTGVIADVSNATNLTAEAAATSFARFSNITGLATKDVGRLASTTVELGNNFAATETEIVNMGLRLAAAAEIAGFTEAETLGLATALSSVGIEAQAGGTAFSRVISDINSAVISGGEKLEAFASVAGVSAEQFAASFKGNPAEAMATFVKGLDNIQSTGGDVDAVLEDLQLNGAIISKTLKGSALASDLFADAMETANRAFEENTALTEEAEKRYATTESQLIMLGNRMNKLSVILGKKLSPLVVKAMRVMVASMEGLSVLVSQLGDAFNSLEKEIRPFLDTLFSGSGEINGKFTKAMEKASSVLQTVFAGAVKVAKNALKALEPVMPVLIEGFRMFVESLIFLGDVFSNVVLPVLEEAFQKFVEMSPIVYELFANIFNLVTTILTPAVELIKFLIGGLAEFFRENFGSIATIVSGAMGMIYNLVKIPLELISGLVKTILQVIKGDFSGAWETIKSTTMNTFGNIANFFVSIWKVISGTFMVALSALATLITNVFAGIWAGIQTVWNGTLAFFQSIWAAIVAVFNFHADIIRFLFETFLFGINFSWEETWNSISAFFSSIWGAIKLAGEMIWNGMKSSATSIWTGIKKTLSGIWNIIKGIFESVWNGMFTFIQGLWGAMTEWFMGDAKAAIEGAFTNSMEGLAGIAKSILNGVLGVIEGFINAAVTAINSLIEAANSIPFNPIQLPLLAPVALPRLFRGGVVGKDGYGDMQEFKDGGLVRGAGGIDNVPILASAGEIVLNAAQQQNVASGLQGNGGTTVIVNVSGNEFVAAGVDLAEQVGDQIMDQFRQQFVFESF